MSHQYKAVAAILKNTIASIKELLKAPEDELHCLSVTNDLQRTHDRLLLLTGTGDLEGSQSAVLGPAKTIGGKPITKLRKFTEADMVPSDDKVFQLKQEIEAAIFYFSLESNAEGILANIPDLIIRGVAKKAGMPVTKDEPKELTVEFIEEVKAAVALLPKEKGEDFDDEGNEQPNAGQGGLSESHIMNPEDNGLPLSEGKVETPGEEAVITDPVPDVKADEPKIEPKQDPKSEQKKKAGK